MINNPEWCDCRVDYSEEEITGEEVKNHYHGHGIWQCPECATLHDYSEKVYTVKMEYKENEDGIEVEPIELDERLLVPPEENQISLKDCFMEDFREGGGWDYDGIEGHPLGIYEIEIWWEWGISHTDCGTDWDLEMKIISEKEVAGDVNG